MDSDSRWFLDVLISLWTIKRECHDLLSIFTKLFGKDIVYYQTLLSLMILTYIMRVYYLQCFYQQLEVMYYGMSWVYSLNEITFSSQSSLIISEYSSYSNGRQHNSIKNNHHLGLFEHDGMNSSFSIMQTHQPSQ